MNKLPLLELYNLIKKSLTIKTQSLFYNIIFNFVEYDNPKNFSNITLLKNNIGSELNKLYSEPNYASSVNCDKFMENFFRYIHQYTKFVDTYEKNSIKDYYTAREMSILSLKSNAPNANNTFKNKRALPSSWINLYYKKNKNPNTYKTTLAWILQYYVVFGLLFNNKFSCGYEKIKSQNPIHIGSYTEYFSLSSTEWKKLSYYLQQSGLSLTEIDNFYGLADIIFNCIIEQHNQRIGLSGNTQSTHKKYQSLNTHLAFYHNNISCYGTKLMDRFNMLKKYADTNVYCANELAEIYYYGDVFYTETRNNIYEIPKDYNMAKFYYEKCINQKILLPVACWSLGYMYYSGKLQCSSKEESIEYARKYFLLCEGYPAALNSLGNIERETADNLYDYKKGLSSYSEKEVSDILSHYKAFLDYALASAKRNYIFGYTNLYNFFFLSKYKEIIAVLKKEPTFPSVNYLFMLKQAADLGNSWSMDRLACHYIAEYLYNHLYNLTVTLPDDINVEILIGMINSGEISLKNLKDYEAALLDLNIWSAEEYLLKASSLNYDRAKKHLEGNY